MEAAYSLFTPDGALTAVIPLNWIYNSHRAFSTWLYQHAPHIRFPLPPGIFEAKIETVVVNLYGPKYHHYQSGFSLIDPHPYDIMDLEDVCTFDADYWEWVDRLRAGADRLATDLPDWSAFRGSGGLIPQASGVQSGFGNFQ